MAEPGKCKFCGKEKCYTHCQDSKDGKHVVDPDSGQFVSGSNAVTDFNCRLCGQSGAVSVDLANIQWD